MVFVFIQANRDASDEPIGECIQFNYWPIEPIQVRCRTDDQKRKYREPVELCGFNPKTLIR